MIRCCFALLLACACQVSSAQSTFEKREHREGEKKLGYRLLIPQSYDQSDKSKMWPLIIWLHGSGEKGSNNTSQLSAITNTFLGDNTKCPALVMAPQCPADSSWLGVGLNVPPKITDPSRMIVATIAELQQEFNLDERRIYLGGFSMGGCGAWDLLSRYPQLFAAAFPIAGPPGDRPGLAPLIKEVPIWVFHGDKDNVAPVDSSRTIVAALKAAGSSVKYTEYKNGGHETHQALADPALQEWIFGQRRAESPVFTPSPVPANASLITKTLPQGTRDTWTGKVEKTRHHIPRLVIEEVRYSLKPAPGAAAEVAARLDKIGKGEANGDHKVTGTIQLEERPWVVVEQIAAVADEELKPITVLLIGNSQCPTIVGNQLLEKLAASDKGARPIKVTGAVRGGASLKSHWEAGTGPETARGEIVAGKFDFVVLQDIYFVEEAAFQPFAREFHKLIKESGSQTVLFGTASILSDYPQGFERLSRLHVAMGKELKAPIVDASQAYFRYFGEKPSNELKESLFAKDRAHPGLQGSYLYSCIIYSVLTGRSAVGLAAPEAIPADVAKKLQETAWAQYQETMATLKK